jgi:outer membrane lipopolysaccharide assembly protein LptE/RlpB
VHRISRIITGLIVIGLSTSFAGCGGWYLRGSHESKLSVKRLYVRAAASGPLYTWFLTELSYSGVQVASSPAQADAIIELTNEQYDRRVLSVDPQTGKVREMELGLQVEITVRKPDGSLLVAPDKLSWTQDFVFDESSPLGTEEVETTIRYEIAKDAARGLVIRLEAIDFPTAKANAG